MTPNTNSRLLNVFYLTQSAKEVNELGQTLGSWKGEDLPHPSTKIELLQHVNRPVDILYCQHFVKEILRKLLALLSEGGAFRVES